MDMTNSISHCKIMKSFTPFLIVTYTNKTHIMTGGERIFITKYYAENLCRVTISISTTDGWVELLLDGMLCNIDPIL